MGGFVGDGISKGRFVTVGGFVGDGIIKGRGVIVWEVLSGMDVASAVGVTLTW